MKPYETKLLEKELIKRMSHLRELNDDSILLLKAFGESLLYKFCVRFSLKFALL